MGKKKRQRGAHRRKDRTEASPPPAAPSPTSPPSPSRDLLRAAGLALLAWFHRVAFLVSNRDRSWPFTVFYEGDSRTFFNYARALLDGRLYDSGIPFHPPGFPAFLAAVHTLLGAGDNTSEIPHLAVKVTLALVSSLSVGLLYLLVRPYLGRMSALLTALLSVYHFGLYVIAVAPVSEGLYLTLLLAALLLWSRKLEHPLAAPGTRTSPKPRRVGLALGVVLGILALLRAESVLVAALVTAAGLWGVVSRARRESRQTAPSFAWKPGLLPWILVVAGWVLAVSPWAVRNAVRLTQYNEAHASELAEPLPTFVPLTIYGPINLALANHADSDGTFSADPINLVSGASGLDFTLPRHLRFVLHGDEMAWKWIRGQPGDFARLVLSKWALCSDVFKLGWTQWNWPGGLVGERRPIDVFVPDAGPARWAVPLLALLGWIVCLRIPGGPRRWAVLVGLLTGAGLVTTGLFFGYVRQALLLLPVWFSLAVAAPLWMVSRGRWLEEAGLADRLPKGLRLGLAGLALVLLVVEGLGMRADRNYQATGESAGRHLIPDVTVRLEVLPPSK